MMQKPIPPRRIPAPAGGILETTIVAIGTTCLFVAATFVAFAAAAVAGDDPALAALIAVIVWVGVLVGGVLGAQRLARVVGRVLGRWRGARARGPVRSS